MAVMPRVIGDQTETAGEARHEPNARIRASPAMPLASAAYAYVVIWVEPFGVNIRGFIRPWSGAAVN